MNVNSCRCEGWKNLEHNARHERQRNGKYKHMPVERDCGVANETGRLDGIHRANREIGESHAWRAPGRPVNLTAPIAATYFRRRHAESA